MNHSPFYKEKLADFSNSIPLRNLEEFQQFPFTTSDDISEKGQRMVCTFKSNRTNCDIEHFRHNRYGETNLFHKDDQQLTVDFFAYGMSTLISPIQKF
jgi:hypothetical protein